MTTRQHILDILSEREATIEQIADGLKIKTGKSVSTVTIRYHLNVLLEDGMLIAPRSILRGSRGRPQHVFAAVPAAQNLGNTAEVLLHVLAALRNQPDVSDMIIQRAAMSMGKSALVSEQASLAERMDGITTFLNSRGYEASSEEVSGGYILYTHHCPYHEIPDRQSLLCSLDMRMIENVLGQHVQRLTRLADGDDTCAYFVENNEEKR